MQAWISIFAGSLLQVAEPLDAAPDLVEALQFSTRSGAPMRTSGTAVGS